ncbi:MAG: alpha/beta hydrolase [Polyangiaceae bacterium]
MTRLLFAFVVLGLGWRTWLRRRRHGPLRPGWSWLQETIVAGMRYNGERLMSLSPVAARRRLEELALPASRKVAIETFTIGKTRAQWLTRKGFTDDTTILYFHGGGFVLSSVDGYRELFARIALTCKARVLAIDYRLAPESPFPAAAEDCLAAYRWALANGVDPKRMLLAGDSSGGGLAVTTLVAARDAGDGLPRGAILLSPWVDLEAGHASVTANAAFDWGDRDYLSHWSAQYLNGADPRDPRASPLYADFAGLPPLLVQVGTAELLYDEVAAFADKARAEGVEVIFEPWPEMVHGWTMLNDFFPQAQEALEAIARFCAS